MNAGQEAFYTITLNPETRLPSTTAFKITMPREIELIDADVNDCYIDTSKVIKNRCYYSDSDTLEIRNGMYHFKSSDYFGSVRIVFVARNPPSNFYTGIELILEISLDSTFKYPIASIEGGLTTSFECNYPCISCSGNNPDDCESCGTGLGERSFLQTFKETGVSTCKAQCDEGFTWDN